VSDLYKKIFKIKFSILVFLLVAAISAANICIAYLFLPGRLKQIETVIIEPLHSTKAISDKLKRHKIIKHPRLFLFLSKIYSSRHPLKSGEYMFTPGISPLQVLKVLASGKSVIHRLVIPEGVMVSEIVDKVNREPRLLGEIKGVVPEGYLMPSIYFYSYGDLKERIIEQMRKKMTLALDEVMTKLTPDSPLKNRLEVLILASIVEKETGLESERTTIAGVFINRLKKGMKLQADPTSIYAVTEGKYKLTRPLTKKDLAIISPYNTYYAQSLPPGPIACPGVKSLQAVVNPAKTNALYFVVNGKGGHNFASTLKEHNENVLKYRQSKIPENSTENP